MLITQALIESSPTYKQKTRTEYSAGCPACGGTKRFLFWPDTGNYWCRECELKGFVGNGKLTPEQKEEAQRLAKERAEQERQERLSAIEKIAHYVGKVEWYHGQVNQALDYWYSQGLNDDTIHRFLLGYSHLCPTYPPSPSYTIPSFIGQQLVTIRHRLAAPNGCGKYRPEFAGLPAQPFNVNALKPCPYEISFSLMEPGEALLVEGEVKTMYLDQAGFPAFGVPGFNTWRDGWVKYLKYLTCLYIILDPDADNQLANKLHPLTKPKEHIAKNMAQRIKNLKPALEVRLVTLPVKPDDFFVIYKGSIDSFLQFIRLGKPVEGEVS